MRMESTISKQLLMRLVGQLLSFALLIGALFVYAAPARADTGSVKLDCNNNLTGPRKSTQCEVSQPQLGMTWKGGAGRARKLYIKKPDGDTGLEVLRLWIDGKRTADVIITPKFDGHIFLKRRDSTISVRVEIETTKLPSTGPSKLYVHLETLDAPIIPDLASCSNTVTADRESVCFTGRW
jgi:hypothetical protein